MNRLRDLATWFAGKPRLVRYSVYAAGALVLLWAIEFTAGVFVARSETRIVHADGLTATVLLGPADLDGLGALGDDFDIAQSNSAVLDAGRRLYEVDADSGGLTDLDLPKAPDSFAFDNNDVMLTVSDGFLGMLNDSGTPVAGVPIPFANARLARSAQDGAVYLMGGKDGDYRLYRFLEDGRFQILLQSAAPLVAAADNKTGTYAATASLILRIASPQPVVMFKAPDEPGWGPILSLAAAPDGLLFFSTPKRIYALKGGIALSVVNNSGGILRLRGARLDVLDRGRRLFYTLAPASLALFTKETP